MAETGRDSRDSRTTLSVVIATEGKRPTLRRAVNSALKQLSDYDDVIVVGPQILPCALSERVRRVIVSPGNNWGNSERNLAMRMCRSTHIMFLDDDDAYLPDMLQNVRSTLSLNPCAPHMFQMIDLNGAILWQTQDVKMGNVGTPMFVFPNNHGRLGDWSERYEADYDFICSTLSLSEPLVWVPQVIVGCRTYGDIQFTRPAFPDLPGGENHPQKFGKK